MCYIKFGLKRIVVFDDTSLTSGIKAPKFRWETGRVDHHVFALVSNVAFSEVLLGSEDSL